MELRSPASLTALRARAERLDAEDPLRDFPGRFVVTDPDVCYLDGNSLGRLPRATVDRVTSFLHDEWGTWLVDGWSRWIDAASEAGNLLASTCLGTGPGQTLVVDTTSVNFYQLCLAVVRAQSGRSRIVADSANFPTDRYILQGIADAHGLTLTTLDTDGTGGPGRVDVESDNERLTAAAIAPHLGPDVALLTLQAINYRSGARPEIKEITDLSRSHGIPVVWDCSHAVGAIDLDFDGNGIDLAVGCTYKYLNSGPGSPGWLFVRSDWQERLRVPIQGWFAQADQFVMGPVFDRASGIRGFQIASPSIIGIRMVEESLRMIGQAGIQAIEEKARRGTELMVDLWQVLLEPLGFTLKTPADSAHRGGHITLGHPEAKQIAHAMRTAAKVIPDYREPASIRLAISPLAARYQEMLEGFERTAELVSSGRYKDVPLPEGRVT